MTSSSTGPDPRLEGERAPNPPGDDPGSSARWKAPLGGPQPEGSPPPAPEPVDASPRLGGDTCTGASVSMWTLFAYALVPLWLGGGVTLVEADRRRRRVMAAMVASGAVALPWLLNTALVGSVHARAADAHVQYLTEPMTGWVVVAYGLALLGPPLLSTGPWLRLGGILGMASWLAARAISMPGLPSLWCMAAAVLSSLVLLHLRSAAHPRMPIPARVAPCPRVTAVPAAARRGSPAG